MTLSQLRYAVAVDSHRHFGRAADACFVTQPTLSTQIQKLEDELDARLFDRSRKPVAVTPLGEAVLEQARRVLREADRVPELVREAAGRVEGTLRLGLLPTLAPYLLPRLLPAFTDAYPDVRLVLEELRTDAIVDGLRTDRLDAGLVAEDVADNHLQERPLFDEPFVAYVGVGHRLAERVRVTSDDVKRDDLWLLSRGHCFRDQAVQVCGDEPDDAQPVDLESGSLETLRTLVEHHGGMTLLPMLAVTNRTLDGGHVLPFERPAPTRTVRLATRRTQLKQRLLDALVDRIRTALPDTVDVIGNA